MDKEFINEMEKQREVMQKLTADREVFKNLIEAYFREDHERFASILDKLQIIPYCTWICRWICYTRCEFMCHKICVPIPMK